MTSAQIIKHYLSFSRGEQRGIFILTLIILSVNLFRLYLPDAVRLNPVEFSTLSIEMSQFRAALPPDSSESAHRNKDPLFKLELNRADTLDLQRLRGIGPSFARRITGYRKRLGGFTSVEQLMEVYGMDSNRYMSIRPYLMVDSTLIQQMNLNVISFKELIAHPYMPYEFAKEIALYRKKHKGIMEIEELEGLKSYDSAVFIMLRPYLVVSGPL
ncbi:MAG: helix-hairpin-helix domain-containing protein [Bacteroidales bacterium]|nr:helix-hairpin-helix domain-containing protein [Bacteroidales bacterium]